MCAPGSKLARTRVAWLLYLMSAVMYCLRYLAVHYELFTLSTASGITFAELSDANSKWHYSEETVWEIDGLNAYVTGLSHHTMTSNSMVFTTAAFDLDSAAPTVLTHGVADWTSFMTAPGSPIHRGK